MQQKPYGLKLKMMGFGWNVPLKPAHFKVVARRQMHIRMFLFLIFPTPNLLNDSNQKRGIRILLWGREGARDEAITMLCLKPFS